jgi:hypothetical protein
MGRQNPYAKSPMISSKGVVREMRTIEVINHYMCSNLLQHILGLVVMSFQHDKITYIDNYLHVPVDRSKESGHVRELWFTLCTDKCNCRIQGLG